MSDHRVHYGPFAPLLIGLLTLAMWFGFQTVQLLNERETLANLRDNQTQIFSNAQKMRTQLDSLAAETAKLASAGNQNAALLVNALRQRGITIDPSKVKPSAEVPSVKK